MRARASFAERTAIAAPGAGTLMASAAAYLEKLVARSGTPVEAGLTHPLRVADLLLALDEEASAEAVVVALLHNALERGTAARDELIDRFGPTAVGVLEDLAPDRSTPPDRLGPYYERISRSRVGGVVKLVDKLDNLFILDVNPDAAARSRYLDEIERWVLPLADRDLPALRPYLEGLVAYHRSRPEERRA